MGADIHFFVEQRLSNGRWALVVPPAPPPEFERTEMRDEYAINPVTALSQPTGKKIPYVSPFWGPGGCMYSRECYGHYDRETEEEVECTGDACVDCLGTRAGLGWYQSRNYSLFSILTSTVRNDDRDPFIGIVPEPRGVPADADPTTVRSLSNEHSPGWLSLREVTEWGGWDRVKTHTGVIPLFPQPQPMYDDLPSYREWSTSERKSPESYCVSVGGGGSKTISSTDADRILAAPDQEHLVTHREEKVDLATFASGGGFRLLKTTERLRYIPGDLPTTFYVQVTWNESYRTSAKGFLDFLGEVLNPTLAARGISPDDVRFIFDFDS